MRRHMPKSSGKREYPNRNGTGPVRPGRGLDPEELLDNARRKAVLSEYARHVAGSPVNPAQEIARALEHAFKAGVAAARIDQDFEPSARQATGPRDIEAIDIGPRARDTLARIKLFATDPTTNEIGPFLVRPGMGHPVLPNTDILTATRKGLTLSWGTTTTRTLANMGFLVPAPGRPDGEFTGSHRCLEYLQDGVVSTSTPDTAAWSWPART